VAPLREALKNNADLWGKYNYRGEGDSPHSEMTDIWIRFNDIKPYLLNGDMTGFDDEHESSWYPSAYFLPEVKQIIFEIMYAVAGERLGGVLLTKLPPGGYIEKHKDFGWHAEYYDKYFVPIQNKPGSIFGFDDGGIDPLEGEVYWFNNQKEHWVENNTDQDRIAMIICIKTDRQGAELCHAVEREKGRAEESPDLNNASV